MMVVSLSRTTVMAGVLILGILCPSAVFAQQSPVTADYGNLDTDKIVIHNQSTALQVLPAGPDAWKTITQTVRQFLPALGLNGIEVFVGDTTDTNQSRPGFCYSRWTGQLSSKNQWLKGANGALRWNLTLVLPANNLNNGQNSYSGDVSKGLAYILDSSSLDRLLDNCANPRLLSSPAPTHAETRQLWDPAPLLLVSARENAISAVTSTPDYDIPNGHFYTQANGQGGAGGTGYAVVDDDAAAMWSEFQRLGGVAVLGYPISQRYTLSDGLTYQAFQKAILQWDPQQHLAHFANVFDQLSNIGRDQWLATYKQTPAPQDWSADTGQPWDKVLANHLGLLDRNPAIKNAYLQDPFHIDHYGLPMGYADYGTVAVMRCQRAVFQQWKVATQFATTNQVLVANGGDNAKDAGLIPSTATSAVPPPPPTLSPFEPGSSGAQLDDATLSRHLGGMGQ